MLTVTRRFTFCAGHRLLGHKGKCRFLHGHNYVAKVMVTIGGVNSDQVLQKNDGMVVDFGDMKEKIGDWIDREWDHNMILHPDDPLLFGAIEDLGFDIFAGKKPFVMPKSRPNPTAENMTGVLREVASSLCASHWPGRSVISVVIEETESCSAMG